MIGTILIGIYMAVSKIIKFILQIPKKIYTGAKVLWRFIKWLFVPKQKKVITKRKVGKRA